MHKNGKKEKPGIFYLDPFLADPWHPKLLFQIPNPSLQSVSLINGGH